MECVEEFFNHDFWAIMREEPWWHDDENKEMYGDFYHYWDMHHGFAEEYHHYDHLDDDEEQKDCDDEDKSITFFSDDWPHEEGTEWEINLTFNECEKRPILDCRNQGYDASGNEWDYDCTAEQTPTPNRYEEWT